MAGGEPLRIGLGSLGDAYGLAVSGFAATAGRLYVGDATSDTVKAYDPAVDPASPVQTIDGAGTPQHGFDDLVDTSLAVDSTDGSLLVVDDVGPELASPPATVEEFGPSGAFLGALPHQFVDGGPSGIAVGPTGTTYVTSGDDEGAVVYAFGPSGPAKNLTVSKAGAGAGLVETSLPGIECGAACNGASAEFSVGTSVTLTARSSAHSTFQGWAVAGAPSACPGTSPCHLTLATDAEVTARFEAVPQRTLTVARAGAGSGVVASQPQGIDCGSSCSLSADQGAAIVLSAVPARGSVFAGWSGGGCSGGGDCEVRLGTDAQVTARFEPAPLPPPPFVEGDQRLLAIVVGGSGSGAISSDPGGIECGSPCSGAYPPGTRVTLSAVADPGSRFAGWSGCDSVAGNRCTVALGASRTLGASFEEAAPLALEAAAVRGVKATLKVAVPGPGTLSASGKLLRPARATAKRAGAIPLSLALTKAGAKALAARGKLKLDVQVRFAPADGGTPVVLAKKLSFG
jgi:hypothetical protein